MYIGWSSLNPPLLQEAYTDPSDAHPLNVDAEHSPADHDDDHSSTDVPIEQEVNTSRYAPPKAALFGLPNAGSLSPPPPRTVIRENREAGGQARSF